MNRADSPRLHGEYNPHWRKVENRILNVLSTRKGDRNKCWGTKLWHSAPSQKGSTWLREGMMFDPRPLWPGEGRLLCEKFTELYVDLLCTFLHMYYTSI